MPLDDRVLGKLRKIVGRPGLLSDPDELLVYEYDAYPLARALPGAVVFPATTEQASQVLGILHSGGIAFVPRGTGTSLAGGCLCDREAVVVCTARMKRILELDFENECAVVQAGVVTQEISDAAGARGYYYAPDPSSQTTCTIGGNIANNAGGPHTLKYGVTSHHILGLTVVLPDGAVLKTGGKTATAHGYDLTSVMVGSEGTLGLVTEAIVKLQRVPPACRTVLATFDRITDAGNAVSEIIASGITPAALEMMDQAILLILEDAYAFGFPRDAEAILVIELEGIEAGLDRQLDDVVRICRRHCVRNLDQAANPEKRAALWKARKTAFGALGRRSPTCVTQDGVVPRSRLPHILDFIARTAAKHKLEVANMYHAGDGNIHPNFLFDIGNPRQVQAVREASHEILAECVRVGGSVTGEHGIGCRRASNAV